uniref:Uncharacterized protein n=1 Tax=Nelumbo nucifera TaxID=4432 RepID=A0A822YYN0_NELNU|nr:TPA_asm: hypothetical protein HUJ06_006476 [Nelumbo nucifera]
MKIGPLCETRDFKFFDSSSLHSFSFRPWNKAKICGTELQVENLLS